MVNFMLMISAELDNITDLQPQDGCDDPNYTYYFKLKCGQCGEVTEKETCLSFSELLPRSKGKGGDVHLSQKCKFCCKEGTVLMITGRGKPLTNEQAEQGQYAPIMQFECRGYEPVDFVFGSGWKAVSLEGTKFNDIDLSDGEFYDYDEKGECPVMISNLRAKYFNPAPLPTPLPRYVVLHLPKIQLKSKQVQNKTSVVPQNHQTCTIYFGISAPYCSSGQTQV